MTRNLKCDGVTRFEVIDETGRVYVRDPRVTGPVEVELSLQDDDKTLKVFVKLKKEPTP